MKAAIDMMPRKLPDGEYTHTGAWAHLRANQFKHVGKDVQVLCEKGRGIKSDWSEFDTVYLYHTMDFEPEHPYLLNIFDGPQEHTAKFFERLIWPIHDHVKMISLDYPMPNYGYRCRWKRDRADLDSKMSDYWRNVDWDAVQAKCETVKDWILDPGVELTLPYQGRVKEDWIKQCVGVKHLHRRLAMGDSHTLAVYQARSLILRKDGRTLNGILKKTLKREVTDFGFDWDQVDEVTTYYGNIDIRHHICRESDPVGYTKDLIKGYEAELRRYPEKTFEVVCPLPIEDESRKLPASGCFMKTPFFGTRAQRQELVDVFTTELQEAAHRNGWKVFSWPEHWFKMDGVEFMETIMERPRSVHLARKYYRWDLTEDCSNKLLEKPKTSLLSF